MTQTTKLVIGLLLALVTSALSAAAPERLDVDQIAFAQAQVFDEGAGLTDLTTTAISASEEGYVWVGTMRGVSRFNGHRMVPVPGPGGVLRHPIRDLIALPDGTVWVATGGNGLHRLHDGQWTQLDTKVGLPTASVVRLRAFDGPHGKRLFATGRHMLAEWDGRAWHPRALPDELAELEIRDVLPVAGPRGEVLWVASYGKGLYRCEPAAPCVPAEIPVPGERFYEITALGEAIEADGSHTVWAGADGGGLARLHDGQWERITPRNSILPGDSVTTLEVLNTHGEAPQVWVGLRGGLARLRRGHWEHMDYVGLWASGRINALHAARDSQGRTQMWVGSDSGAVRMRLQDDWRIVSRAGKGRAGIWALRFEKDAQGERLWLGTDGEGLLRYQDSHWSSYGVDSGLPDKTVRSLARVPTADGGDQLWAGTWRGHLARFDGARFHVIETPWPKREDEALSVILPVAAGDVWIALRSGGVAHLSNGSWHWFDPADAANPGKVLGMLETGSGDDATIWTSTFGQGLARYRHGQWYFLGPAQGMPDSNYTGLTLMPDASGKQLLWVGSLSHGLVRLDISDPDNPQLVTKPALPPLPDDYVYGAMRDASGDIIVCTNYGVARWHPVPGDGYTSLVYHRSDGLPHDECNAGAMQRDAYGRIWIGTIGGAAVYVPQAAAIRGRSTPLRLERTLVDGEDRTAAFHPGKLPYEASLNNLEVQFSLLTGERESLNQYRSQLAPLEKAPGKWGESNSRSFTGLPPGDYRLRIEARDYAGTESVPLVLAFKIPMPWWRTLPAFIGAALLLLGLIWLWMRWRDRAARKREKNLVRLIRERTAELERRGDELGRMNEELTRLSYRDPLTDLANRRMLVKHLEDEWEIGVMRSSQLAFLLFDLDEFKSYNDIYGHLAGDDCLRQIARRIHAELRKSDDSAGRYGGEEFGVVLPGLGLEQALIVAERIRAAVERAGLPHRGSVTGIVTISVGAASCVPTDDDRPDSLIAAADKALYRAKQAGRNRVES